MHLHNGSICLHTCQHYLAAVLRRHFLMVPPECCHGNYLRHPIRLAAVPNYLLVRGMVFCAGYSREGLLNPLLSPLFLQSHFWEKMVGLLCNSNNWKNWNWVDFQRRKPMGAGRVSRKYPQKLPSIYTTSKLLPLRLRFATIFSKFFSLNTFALAFFEETDSKRNAWTANPKSSLKLVAFQTGSQRKSWNDYGVQQPTSGT